MKKGNFLLLVLNLSLVGFVILTWWVLFRDERALVGFESVYPFFNGRLFFLRETLLKYSLNVIPTVLFAILGITSFGVYYLLLKEKFSVKKVIKWAIIFQLIAFLSYPVLSTDIFSYMFSNRVQTEYGQNKWLVTPDNFPNDKFEQFADWKHKTNVYGYINHIIYVPSNYFGNDDIFITLLLYKLTVATFAFLSIFVLKAILVKKSKQDQSFYLKLIFWNPLFLLEILGTGHNDMLLIFFLFLSILAWNKKSWLWAGVLLALSMQIKLITIIFFGYFALNLLQNKKLSALVKYSSSFIFINILSFALMRVNPLTFITRVLYNAESYWQSLPGLQARFFPSLVIPFTLIFAVFGLILIYLQIKKNLNPLYTSFLAIFTYLLFFTGAYWNWYVLWIFVLIPLIKSKSFKNATILFTFTSLMAYPLLWISFRFGFGNPIWDIISYIWIFGVPIIFLVYNKSTLQKNNKGINAAR